MSSKTIVTTSPGQTKTLGFKLARAVSGKGPAGRARVFGLQGRLGSGKTTFAQGFARGLGVKEKITSPTYVLMKKYQFCRRGSGASGQFTSLYHIDCYRIEEPKELLRLGWRDICSQKTNIVLIEWPEEVKKVLPSDTVFIRFFHLSADEPDKRKIIMEE